MDFKELKGKLTLPACAEHQGLPKDNFGKYCCPACGSGSGPHGTSALSFKDEDTAQGWWHCFSCGAGGDVFDFAGAHLGKASKRDQAKAVAAIVERHGCNGELPSGYCVGSQNAQGGSPASASLPRYQDLSAEELASNRAREASRIRHLRSCDNLADPDFINYINGRGISLTKAWEWGLGYSPRTRRVIIPWKGCDYYHIDRAIDEGVVPKYTKPRAGLVGPEPLYNASVVKGEFFFVVEGVFDALAIMECGYPAIAINKAGDVATAQRIIAAGGGQAGCALVMLDVDETHADGRMPGQEGQAKLIDAFHEAGIDCVECPICADMGFNDPFDAWKENSSAFKAELDRFVYEAML